MDLMAQLLAAKRVALDSMIFIYLLEKNETYFPSVEIIFELLEKERIEVVTSMVSPLEVLSAPKLVDFLDQASLYLRFFKQEKNLFVREVDWEITEMAADIRRKYGLRAPDSIQLATAKLENAKLFFTNDQIYKKIGDGKNFPEICLLSEISSSKLKS